VNITELAGKIDLEEDEYIELLELFIETTVSLLEKLQSGLDAGNARQVVDASHSIKGAASNLGLEKTAEVAKKVEENGRQNILEGTEEAIKQIKAHCDQLTKSLKKENTP